MRRFQVVPFQISAAMRLTPDHTATQERADEHDTLGNEKNWIRVLGVGWTLHLLPFQCSARRRFGVSASRPTAVHDVGDEHETEVSSAAGLGVFVTVHRDPFHRSATAVMPPAWPTPMQKLTFGHDTAWSAASSWVSAMKVGRGLQRVPFQVTEPL
jgi:hypothetical protein